MLDFNPNSSEAYKLLSQVNEACGDHDLAKQNYNRHLDLKSSSGNDSFERSIVITPSKLKFNQSLNDSNLANVIDVLRVPFL